MLASLILNNPSMAYISLQKPEPQYHSMKPAPKLKLLRHDVFNQKIKSPEKERHKAYRSIVSGLISRPSERALKSLASDKRLIVDETHHWIAFTPNKCTSTGLLFYPGAYVDPKSYATLARQIAEKGYKVVILKMPFNFPMLAPGKGQIVLETFPEILTWGVSGHSLGGVSASSFAYKHPDKIKALFCYASFPATNLSKSTIKTKVILGSEDSLVDRWSFFNFKKLLPEEAEIVVIDGGNHANFGDYGYQLGDSPATISRQAQQKRVVNETIQGLKDINT